MSDSSSMLHSLSPFSSLFLSLDLWSLCHAVCCEMIEREREREGEEGEKQLVRK
jgi:hypothetical protein